jgi:hypothetical protein
LRVACCVLRDGYTRLNKLRITDYGLRITHHGLWITDYGLRITDYALTLSRILVLILTLDARGTARFSECLLLTYTEFRRVVRRETRLSVNGLRNTDYATRNTQHATRNTDYALCRDGDSPISTIRSYPLYTLTLVFVNAANPVSGSLSVPISSRPLTPRS